MTVSLNSAGSVYLELARSAGRKLIASADCVDISLAD